MVLCCVLLSVLFFLVFGDLLVFFGFCLADVFWVDYVFLLLLKCGCPLVGLRVCVFWFLILGVFNIWCILCAYLLFCCLLVSFKFCISV